MDPSPSRRAGHHAADQIHSRRSMSVSSHQDITTTQAEPAPLGPPGSAPGPDLGPATVLGYPRIGPHRELKVGLEAYWAGASTQDDLLTLARELRAATRGRVPGPGPAHL